MAVKNNAVGGRGPCGGRVGGGGKRESMAGKPGPKSSRGPVPAAKVRQLQRRLCVAAKRSPGRRFHALYDRIHRSDVLWEAWRRVRRNKGSAGVDAQTLFEVESYGVDRFVEEIGAELRAGRYRPRAVLRRYIPKADGKKRPLGIPTVRDRVVQMAATLVLEPIFGAARNGIDQAGERPAAAIARFGCVAVPDTPVGRPQCVKAQANVLGAERSDPAGGLANSGAVAVANTTASTGSSRVNWVCGMSSGPSLSKMGAGQRGCRRNGNEQAVPAPAYR